MSSNVQSNFVLTLTNVCIQQPDTKAIYHKYYENSNKSVNFSFWADFEDVFVIFSLAKEMIWFLYIVRSAVKRWLKWKWEKCQFYILSMYTFWGQRRLKYTQSMCIPEYNIVFIVLGIYNFVRYIEVIVRPVMMVKCISYFRASRKYC